MDCTTMKRASTGEKRGLVRRFLAWDGCLMVSVFVGVGVGFAVGFTLYSVKVTPTTLMWIGLPGELFMRMLKAAILPLIISSIIAGTAALKPTENGKVSVIALTYIITTNIMGAVIGTVLAVIIHPGSVASGVADDDVAMDTGNLQTSDLFADLIRNLIPDNVVSACFEKSQTRYKEVSTLSAASDVNGSSSSNVSVTYQRYVGTSAGSNILGLVIACSVVGMATARTGRTGERFFEFFKASTEVILQLVQWLIMFTPIGAASLVASAIGGATDIAATFRSLGLFVLAETLGNALLIFVMLPLIYFVFVRKNPFIFLITAARAVTTATVAASSAVAMPELLNCVESRHGVDKRVSSFVVPLLVAINRDGSAMFIALTSIYMAQVQGHVTVDTILLVAILAAVGSLAIPAMPSASIVTILMTVASLGVPPANIGILLALEWFSDRMRTVSNNYSHVVCCAVTWHRCKTTLQDCLGQESDPTLLTDLHPSPGSGETPTQPPSPSANCDGSQSWVGHGDHTVLVDGKDPINPSDVV